MDSKGGNQILPALPIKVGLYISDIAGSCTSLSALYGHVYAIKWAHEFCGVEDPYKHSFPRTIIDDAKRLLMPRKNLKDYLSVHMLINIRHKFATRGSIKRVILKIDGPPGDKFMFEDFLGHDRRNETSCKYP